MLLDVNNGRDVVSYQYNNIVDHEKFMKNGPLEPKITEISAKNINITMPKILIIMQC